MKGLSALLVCLLWLLPCGQVSAVPIIFKTNKSILVRTPSGVVAKPGIGELLATVPGASASVKATGSFPVALGSASVAVPVAKTYAAADIASTAADLILSRTALGLLATLALPYAIDAVTDQFVKQVPGETTEPQIDIVPAVGNNYCITGTCSTSWEAAGSVIFLAPFHVCSVTYTSGSYPGYVHYTVTGYVSAGVGCDISRSAFVSPNACPSGSTLDTATSDCVTAPSCTSPSTYDSATGMCIGSAINEPANAETLAADIEATFNDNPTFPKVALDAVLDADQEPANGQQEIEMPSPQTVPGESKTSTKQYFDPATGHPVTEETTEQTDYKVEKTGPNQLDVKPTTSTTVNITDNVTNVTTTTTNISEISPTEASTETEPQTDCDKYPESIGCSSYGDITPADTIPTTNVDISFSPSSWGEGSCPADVTLGGHFGNGITYTYAPVCQFLSSLAPVLIVVGWLIAGGIVVGGVRD